MVSSYLKIIRFPNLLIVAFTQFLLEFFILIPAFQSAEINPALDIPRFLLLVVSTMLIAAGGYVINDIEDHEIDAINKPERLIINKFISIKNAWIYYFSLFIIGFVISLYLAIYIKNIPLLAIYPSAWILLYLYSVYFKKMPLVGNVVVGIFCALVAGIVWFAERNTFLELWTKDGTLGQQIFTVFSFYLFFAFTSTLFREIVKDIEDMEGDNEKQCRTLPIVFGKKIAKNFAFGIGIYFIIGLFFLYQYFEAHALIKGKIFLIIAMLLPTIFSLFELNKATKKEDYHRVSQLAKLLMLSGILLLFFL